jgi:plasmid stabilization system protein ParE
MIVSFSDAARENLRAISAWIAKDNPGRAATFVRELRAECVKLGPQPRAYPLVDRLATRELRRRSWRNYLIIYEVRTRDVLVVHVLHGARDYESLLDA